MNQLRPLVSTQVDSPKRMKELFSGELEKIRFIENGGDFCLLQTKEGTAAQMGQKLTTLVNLKKKKKRGAEEREKKKYHTRLIV